MMNNQVALNIPAETIQEVYTTGKGKMKTVSASSIRTDRFFICCIPYCRARCIGFPPLDVPRTGACILNSSKRDGTACRGQ